jgi:hypothetical protein
VSFFLSGVLRRQETSARHAGLFPGCTATGEKISMLHAAPDYRRSARVD